MNKDKLFKFIMLVIIGILVYFFMAWFFGEAVSASNGRSKREKGELLPFYWLIIIVGVPIACTLTYVSWRKYKGEKKEAQERQNDDK